jgi:hypothetical protein
MAIAHGFRKEGGKDKERRVRKDKERRVRTVKDKEG